MKNKGSVAVIVFSALIIAVFYSNVLLNLNRTIFGGEGGDAIKNYWVVDYHLRNDDAFTQFKGMNYPNGEHYMFTDGQIALTYPFFLLAKKVGIEQYTVAIVNLAMFISMVLCSFFLYKIFIFYNVKDFWAVLFALITAFMSPQLLRIFGHFALAYGCIVPIIWFFFLKNQIMNKIKYLIFIGLIFTFFSFLHLYYLLILGAFLGLLFVTDFLIYKRKFSFLLKSLLITLVIPTFFVFFFMAVTDSVTDRPPTPVGFLYYKAVPESIFLPINFPFLQWVKANFFFIKGVNFEGDAYVGITVTVVVLLFLWRKLVKKENRLVTNSKTLKTAFFASGVLLAFSMGIPFIWGMEGLFKFLGPIQQFRSIGRFSWPFFYVANVGAFVWLYTQFIKNRASNKSLFRFSPLLGVIIYELWFFNVKVSSNYTVKSTDVFEVRNLKINKLRKKNYQAIYPLPYFWIGSEFSDKLPEHHLFKGALKMASQTGLPIIGNSLSRTSFSHSMDMLKLVYQIEIDSSVFDKYNNKELILIEKEGGKLPAIYDTLMKKSILLMTEAKLNLYSISSEEFKNRKLSPVDFSSFKKDRDVKFNTPSIVEVSSVFESLLIKLPLPKTIKEWSVIEISNEVLKGKEFKIQDYLYRMDASSMYVKIPYSKISSKKFEILIENKKGEQTGVLYFN